MGLISEKEESRNLHWSEMYMISIICWNTIVLVNIITFILHLFYSVSRSSFDQSHGYSTATFVMVTFFRHIYLII